MKITNKRAYHEYFVHDSFEAGIALTGNEVKSLKEGRADLSGSFVRIKDNEAWLMGANIPLYTQSATHEYDPLRPKKLLLHKKEIVSLGIKSKQLNLTLIPISLYTKGRLIKVQIALAKGKKNYEKRDVKRKKDIEMDIKRALKDR